MLDELHCQARHATGQATPDENGVDGARSQPQQHAFGQAARPPPAGVVQFDALWPT